MRPRKTKGDEDEDVICDVDRTSVASRDSRLMLMPMLMLMLMLTLIAGWFCAAVCHWLVAAPCCSGRAVDWRAADVNQIDQI